MSRVTIHKYFVSIPNEINFPVKVMFPTGDITAYITEREARLLRKIGANVKLLKEHKR